ncbi:hypothetical protein JCM10450v2_002129 [Rhodotorula kratochvilovae]
MAAAPSSSYSALLRRSKLAAFNPSIDQVYTTTPANLARANFGLKRPLPQASTTASPFVRLFDLDSREGRTSFRKATRETLYTKKWQETGVGLHSDAYTARTSGGNGTLNRSWDRLEVQSRFVDANRPGAVRDVTATAQTAPRMPNFFAMSERDFERFLADLGDRRHEFRAFVHREAKSAVGGAGASSADEFDLYAHAQRNPLELIRLVERFLRLPPSSPAAPSSAPLPQIHPTLALQYASPTPLESALADPIPGRLLGPSPDASSSRGGGFAGMYGPRNDVYASVLSQVAPIPSPATSGVQATTFFPDATGARSNVPGRAHFRLQAPSINPIPYATRTVIARDGVRSSVDFRPPTAEYEPRALALRALDLRAQVVPPAEAARPKPRPGTPQYSGDLPPEVAKRGFTLGGGARVASLTDLYGAGGLKSLGIKSRPKDILASKRNRRTREEQEQWVRRREALLEQSGHDAKQYAAAGGEKGEKGAEKKGKKQVPRGGRKDEQRKALLGRLESMLENK